MYTFLIQKIKKKFFIILIIMKNFLFLPQFKEKNLKKFFFIKIVPNKRE